MESRLSVAIVPRMVPVSARDASQAAVELGQALQDLNAAKSAGGETDLKRAEDAYRAAEAVYKIEVKQVGVLARIAGQEFPIEAYGVQQDESGAMLLSLVLMPDSLSIGDPPVGEPAAEVSPAAPRVVSWGDDAVPMTLSGQVAGYAERVALGGIRPMSWLRRRGDGGAVAVNA